MIHDRFLPPIEIPEPPPSLCANVEINSDAGLLSFDAEVCTNTGTILSADIDGKAVSREALVSVFGARVDEAERDVFARLDDLIRDHEENAAAARGEERMEI